MDLARMERTAQQLAARTSWDAGDFTQIARAYADGAAAFVGRLGLQPGDRVLDVACGTGNLAIPAAEAGARVIGLDIAPRLLTAAYDRAAMAGLDVGFAEGDAEELPFPDANFDVVMSMFGVMFAPNPDRAAAELLRVCRPGGLVALANWTPGGFSGRMNLTLRAYLAPGGGVAPGYRWGQAQHVRQWLSEGVLDLKTEPKLIDISYPFGPQQVVDTYGTCYGGIKLAFEELDRNSAVALYRDLVELFDGYNEANDGTTCVTAEYLEVMARRAM